jgi:hypothetical protein
MRQEVPQLGVIPIEIAAECKKRHCPLLLDLNGIFVCQPSKLFDRPWPDNFRKIEDMQIYGSQFPEKGGCTRHFDLRDSKKWR